MPEIYDLYVTSGVRGGAQAIGSGKPMIVVLAHELGHIPLRPPSST